MATFRERTPGRWTVDIRKNSSQTISRTFPCKEDAELWAKWKEDLLDNIDNFEASVEELMTLDTAISLKHEDGIKNELDSHTLGSIINLKTHFSDLLDMNMTEITQDILLDAAKTLMTKEVKRGGSKNSGGSMRLPSKETVINRFKYLGTVWGFLQKRGISLTNHPLSVSNYLKDKC